MPFQVAVRLNERALPYLRVEHVNQVGLQGAPDAVVIEYCQRDGLYLLAGPTARVTKRYDVMPFVDSGIGIVQVRFGGTPKDTLLFYTSHTEWLLSLCGDPVPFAWSLTRAGRAQLYP